ncbi:MAG: hypothetical protein A2289_25760 [Deltaproteobacteria bacterium RIFOXYA12_FULL_58_15]|nr:MAG: hypothetical protein A2289_25760 [Deltaproteobacteria bacterium RIFOXYA12_FULL_58_15]OGR11222.1 MAG: hypothetical protein A2341_24900 [Deltaproteobacteria bacterium RIFOXYB12_FULL_58_9]
MRYWDTSALVPLLVKQAGSDLVRDWITEDPRVVTWALSSVELCGAIERLCRTGLLDAGQRHELLRRVKRMASDWGEIIEFQAVRRRAIQLLARHSLRAADSLQLGAAWAASEGQPDTLDFVCLDRNLSDAAEREGFNVFSW